MKKRPIADGVRLILVGSPEDTGFKEKEGHHGLGDRKKVDAQGVTWYEAVITVCDLAFSNYHERLPSLSAEWIGGTLYQVCIPKDPETNLLVANYGELQDLAKKDPARLLNKYTVVKDYAIPTDPKARKMFTYAVRLCWGHMDRMGRIEDNVREAVRGVLNALNPKEES